MNRRKRPRAQTMLIALIVIGAAIAIYILSDNGDGPPFSAFSTAEQGTSLFYDTLRHMDYPVRISQEPLTRTAHPQQVYIIIQPYNPHVNADMAEEMLMWVRNGGRLIFLHNSGPTAIDRLLMDTNSFETDHFTHFFHGLGQVITGRAHLLTNRQLIQDAAPAAELYNLLTQWDTERIWFAEYYHGFHPPETFFSRLPLIVRLVTIQLGVAALALLWHFGKRFGKPVPAYQETEREENEHIRALARLYIKTKKNSRKEKEHVKNNSR